jgi:MoaA/NifB/PqqE/SkfB family radical SAM enzyme
MRHNDAMGAVAGAIAEGRHGLTRRARRALRSREPRTEPPQRPIGGKLEITYACNLRCGFCYTDSPRRTLERTPELDDGDWLRIADELIELGAIEAVVTGGEPLLRRELTIAVCRRLASAGLGVTLNTNGWFVDDETAAALAQAPGLQVHVSVDGPDPDTHDAQRGIPGSWRRAVTGLDALIRHGVATHVVTVITAANADRLGATLELMRDLGVTAIRATRVIEVGGAARAGGWRVPSHRIERTIDRFRAGAGSDVSVVLQGGEGGADIRRARGPPPALLVRPDGAVRIDSLTPFAFGRAPSDPVEECWRSIRERWRDPRVDRWRSEIDRPQDWSGASVVPYLDDEVDLDGDSVRSNGRDGAVPLPVAPDAVTRTHPIEDPVAFVRGLALARRYRLGAVRVGGDDDARIVRRTTDGRTWRLNRSASIVLAALDGGTGRDAAAALHEAYPALGRDRAETDALAAARRLAARHLVLPAEAPAPAIVLAEAPSDMPDEELS